MIHLKAHTRRRKGLSAEPEGTAVSNCMMPSIVTVTGTFGAESRNGVGRFLEGLHDWSRSRRYSLDVFSAGAHLARVTHSPRIHNIHALDFAVPGGFDGLAAFYPLEGRRRQLARAIKDINPDIVHISTPEALGATGLAIARRQRRLVAGIYHSDFPAFARQLVREALAGAILSAPDPRRGWLAPQWRTLGQEYRDGTAWWERWLLGFIGRRVLKRNRARLEDVLNRGADRLAEFAESAVREAMARFYGRFDLVIARSEVYRRRLIDELRLRPDRVRTLRPGVDTRLFSPTPTREDDYLRLRLAVPAGAKVVLYVGRVTDEKNVGFLADAWRSFTSRTARAGRRGPGAVFVVAGGGNLDEFRGRAGAGVQTLGPCDSEMLAALYRRADLFWTASTTETLGQVVLEAQACGVPVLVADRGAAGENVVDGATGSVLPVDSPDLWAGELKQLLDDPGRRVRMAAEARTLAEERTIDASYRHYWELHRELADGHRDRDTGDRSWHDAPLSVTGTLRVPSPHVGQPRQTESACYAGTPAIHVSDFHAGSRSKKIPKEVAFRAVCQRVVDRGARLFLHGDFLDTRPPLHKFRQEVQLVRGVLEEYGIVPELYLEGNHDYEFARDRRIEDLLGCAPAPSLVHHDPATGLVLTHGHVSEVPGVQQLIARAEGRVELVRALSVDRLQQPLRVSALKYDVVGIVTKALEDVGLNGLEDAWRSGLPARRWLADRLMELARKRGLDDCVIRAVIHMIGSSDREEVLSQLCAAVGGWGLIYGHTHEPHVSRHRVIDPLTGEPRTVLLGNCGSFRRKSIPPTWIESDFPHLELWAFDPDGGVAELVDRASLTAEEAHPHESARAVAAGC